MQVKATTRYAKIAPFKLRLPIDEVKGKKMKSKNQKTMCSEQRYYKLQRRGRGGQLSKFHLLNIKNKQETTKITSKSDNFATSSF